MAFTDIPEKSAEMATVHSSSHPRICWTELILRSVGKSSTSSWSLLPCGSVHTKSPEPQTQGQALSGRADSLITSAGWRINPRLRSPLSAATSVYSTLSAVVLATSRLTLGPIVLVRKAAG